MSVIRAISRALSWLEGLLIIIMLTVMVCLAFLQVVLRNFFSTGLLWADPFLRHLVLWIGLLGASLATAQEKHINLDVVTRFVSPRVGNIIKLITNLFAAAVTAFLAKAGWVFLQSEIESADTLFTIGQKAYPAWWFQLIIPIGFGLISLGFLVKMLEHVGEAIRPTPQAPPVVNVPTLER